MGCSLCMHWDVEFIPATKIRVLASVIMIILTGRQLYYGLM